MEPSALPCFKSKSKQQMESSTLPCFVCSLKGLGTRLASYVELLNDVIEPVTFARSAGPGGNGCTIHIYIYILEDCAGSPQKASLDLLPGNGQSGDFIFFLIIIILKRFLSNDFSRNWQK